MSWRAPRYGTLHAARLAGVSALTSDVAFDTDEPLAHLIDDRGGSLGRWSTSAASHWVQVDRGAATPEAIDRLFIPSGHNLDGASIQVDSSATDFGGENALLASTVVASGAIDLSLTSDTARYVRLTITTSGQWAIGEWLLTRTRTLVRGPEPGWSAQQQSNVETVVLSSGGRSGIQRGPNFWEFSWRYRDVTDTTDLAVLAEIEALGEAHPVLIDPPFDTSSVRWCWLEEFRSQQDPAIPAATNADQRQVSLVFSENVG